METTPVQNIARVLRHLVTLTFLCNLLALPLVPKLVQTMNPSLSAALGYGGALWSDPRSAVLVCFLWFCGCCTAVILWQGRRCWGRF